MALVFGLQVQGRVAARCEQGSGIDEPSLQTVMIDSDGDADRRSSFAGYTQTTQSVVLQQRQLFSQMHQHLTIGGCDSGCTALHEQAAHTAFQSLYTLGNCRERQA